MISITASPPPTYVGETKYDKVHTQTNTTELYTEFQLTLSRRRVDIDFGAITQLVSQDGPSFAFMDLHFQDLPVVMQ